MKVLAFTDLHGSKKAVKQILKKAEKADLLVCAGDISDWGKHDKEILKELEKANKPMLLIPGNHELIEELAITAQQFNYVIYLHKGSYQFGEYIFFGYGNQGFSAEEKEFERIANQFKKTLKKNDKVILVTHGPPHGTQLDYIHGRHAGCKTITRFIKEINPAVSISGHLHETFGVKQVLGRTLLINPGPEGKILLL
ncbi:MAG: metallophosphoesterase [archaeon]